MKKSLIALAALATVATAAQAQSSVTVYGIVDVGISRVTNVEGGTTAATGMTNGGLSTSRFGFKGVEDLGSGRNAFFNLEAEILADTGAQYNGTAVDLFHRGAFVGLGQSGLGTVRLGRMNRQDYATAIKFDAFNGNNIGGWIASSSGSTGSVVLHTAERLSNAVEVQTDSLGGFKLTYQHGFGEVAGNASASRVTVYGVEYSAGAFDAAVTVANKNDASSVTTKATSAYAAYNFGVAHLTGGWVQHEVDATSTKISGYHVGARVPVTPKINVLAGYNAFDNDAGKKPVTYALGATYAFSKRTTGYLIGAKSSQDNSSTQNIVSTSKYNGFDSPAAGLNQTAYSVGIRHSF